MPFRFNVYISYTLYSLYISDIDECTSMPCQNGGICTNGVDGYMCACAAGYEGDNCELGKSMGRLVLKMFTRPWLTFFLLIKEYFMVDAWSLSRSLYIIFTHRYYHSYIDILIIIIIILTLLSYSLSYIDWVVFLSYATLKGRLFLSFNHPLILEVLLQCPYCQHFRFLYTCAVLCPRLV